MLHVLLQYQLAWEININSLNFDLKFAESLKTLLYIAPHHLTEFDLRLGLDPF